MADRLEYAMFWLPLWLASCSDGAVIVLGDRDPPTYRFERPRVIEELSSSAKSDNPSLTEDLLEIYFTSERSGGPAEVWHAQRSDRSARFDTPSLVPSLSSRGIETSPIVSRDGLTCWLGSDRAGGRGDLDIWVATRATRTSEWMTPQNVASLNSVSKDIPRPLGEHGSVMPLGSDRDTRNFYQVYFARRTDTDSFSAPTLVSELSEPGLSTVDGYLTDDGLQLFFVRGPAFGPADLFSAARRDVTEPFGAATPISELNTASDERDPFLSADGSELYFASDRSGRYEIYMATRTSGP